MLTVAPRIHFMLSLEAALSQLFPLPVHLSHSRERDCSKCLWRRCCRAPSIFRPSPLPRTFSQSLNQLALNTFKHSCLLSFPLCKSSCFDFWAGQMRIPKVRKKKMTSLTHSPKPEVLYLSPTFELILQNLSPLSNEAH